MPGQARLFSSFFSLLWLASLTAAVFSGLAHLPLFFRYGLVQGGRAEPSVAHYWSAASLLLLAGYALVVWQVLGRKRFMLSRAGQIQIWLLSLIALTGAALLVHNLPSFSIYGVSYAFIKLGHLFFGLALSVVAVCRIVLRVPWLTPRPGLREKSRH